MAFQQESELTVFQDMKSIYEMLQKHNMISMSQEEIVHWSQYITGAWKIHKMRQEKELRASTRELFAPGEIATQLVTLSYDQKLTEEQVIKEMNKTLKWFKDTRLKSMEEPVLRFEFFGTENRFNPHCHIFTYRVCPNGKLADRIRASLKKKIPSIYRVNVTPGTEATQAQYIIGVKKESKQGQLDLDQQMRQKYNLSEYYKLDALSASKANLPQEAHSSYYAETEETASQQAADSCS